ncbi:hypothetical protein TWF281_004865 [Arthrobotrys megalospora]
MSEIEGKTSKNGAGESSPDSTEFSHHDYTVGWVCALPKEQTAATAMLDDIHPDLPKPPSDHNTYTLGATGKHKVVIACLPKGIYGTNSAATVVTRMVGTFPSIKFGLMVGIGGGIPPNVKLGDVVVSTPVGEYPAVVQWDFGKVEKDGILKRTGALNNPPNALLTALGKLETVHEMRGTKIPQYLDDLKTNWPNLAPKYSKPVDPLPVSHNKPHSGHFVWAVILSALREVVITLFYYLLGWRGLAPTHRGARKADGGTMATEIYEGQSREMRVHYGLIASGNRVIKDSKFRDNLNESLGGNLLCVEMEAAGLMNDFPCLVIRGICDYADSSKNKIWQEHAAAVAAAFAKELLSMIPAWEVDQMPTTRVLLGIENQLKEVSKSVDYLRCALHNQQDEAVLDWLTPINYSLQQNDFARQHQPGTGQWLLDSASYQNWLVTKKQTLFCPGIPGAGKTILTSVIVNDLNRRFHQDPNVGVVYIYCNYKRQEEQRVDQFLANILKQLCQRQSSLPKAIRDFHERRKSEQTQPLLTELSTILQLVVALYSRVFITIDALDECQVQTRVKLLEEVFSLQTKCGVNFIATSRFIPEITKEFEAFPLLEIRASDVDI